MPALERSTLLLDEFLPAFDVTRREHLVIDAPPVEVYRAARELDLLTIHSPLADAAMFVRGMPARLGRLVGRREEPAAEPSSMRLADLFDGSGELPGWVGLGEEEGRELVFGAVGRFWQPDIEWRTVPADEFAGFDAPGWGRIAAGVSTLPYGSRTLATYEARTLLNDAESRRRFARYWRLVNPFVGHIMRTFLSTVERRVA